MCGPFCDPDGVLFREQEKEVQNRKKGKRPRGRPRKLAVLSSCSRHSKLKVGSEVCSGCSLRRWGECRCRREGRGLWGGSPWPPAASRPLRGAAASAGS